MKCTLGDGLCAHVSGASVSPAKIPIPNIIPTQISFFEFTVVLLEPIFAAPPSVVAGTPPGGPQADRICLNPRVEVNTRRFNPPSTFVQQIS
jgi:hypothetical protein